MPKITVRRGLWSGVALLAVVVLAVSVYFLARKPLGSGELVAEPSRIDTAGEILRAKQLPEHAELTKYYAKENQPLTQAVVTRAGELTAHPNFIIRITALGVLGNAPEELKIPAASLVAARLKDENVLVRSDAIDVLGRLDAKAHIPDLLPLLNSHDSTDRLKVKRTLKQLGHLIE